MENGALAAARTAKTGRKKIVMTDSKEEFSVGMWGRGDEFQLGSGERGDRMLPLTMMFTKVQITSVACGSKHTIVLLGPSHAPRVFAWGEAQHGQLGVSKNGSMHAMSPVEVKALAPTTTFMVREVGAGGNCSFALTSRQELLVWGDNSNEQLGLGSSFRGVDRVFSPKPLSPNWDTMEMQWRTLYITKAVMGRKFGLAIDKYARVFAWGDNSYGQLGVGDRSPRNTPVMVEGLHQARQIAAGLQHSAAVDSRRQLWTWGDCADGRLGHGVLYTEVRLVKNQIITRSRKRVDSLCEPKCVEFFRSGKDVMLVACGDRFSAAIDGRGDVWTWGSGIYGQLGRGSGTLSSQTPSRVEWTHLTRTPSGHASKKVVRIGDDEDAQKDASSVHDSVSVGPLSRQSSLRQQSSYETAKQSVQDEPSTTSTSKPSHEAPIFRTIQAGPYHCSALTDDGRLFTWGKGKFGVLGQGNEDNHYEPVQVETEDGVPVQRFATGDYHSLAIVEADRLDMHDKGYKLRAIANTDDNVYLAEREEIAHDDLDVRFRTHGNSPVERYNKEGRSAKGQFSNLIDVTEEGNFVIDKGLGKSEEVGQDVIEPARALSVKEAVRDIVLDREGIIASAEKFLGCDGWDLLDEHIPKWPNELCENFDPRLEQATAVEIKSQWGQYAHVPMKKNKGFDDDESAKGRATTSPPESPTLAAATKRSGFTSFKTAMSVEDKRTFDEFHANEIRRDRYCIMDAHTRKRYAKNDLDSANIQDNRTFSQAERFPTSERAKAKDELGPGEYSINDNHPEWPTTDPRLVVKPAGVGITITVKDHHVTQSRHWEPHNPGLCELTVKEVLKGGSVEQSGKELTKNDVILKVDGEPVTDLYQCRRKLMGDPGTRVTILYKHKDSKSGESIKLNHTFVRTYIGKDQDRTGDSARTEIHPVPGRYMGVGLEAPRFDDRDILTEEQEAQVLKIFEQLQDDLAPNRDEMFKGSPFILPKDPGIKRITGKMLEAFPEWSEELSRPTAILRVLKKHGKLQRTYSDIRDNPHVAPGSYSPKRTAAHNWTLDGQIAQRTVTYASASGPKMVAPPEKEKQTGPEQDIQQEAAQIVIGRELAPGEIDRLPMWKQRKMNDIMAAMDKRDDSGPGPAQYSSAHPESIGNPRMTYKSSENGHHLKGARMAQKIVSNGASTQESPGPNHYNVVREGLDIPGDFKDKKGNIVVFHDLVGPAKAHADETPGFCIKPGSFSVEGHPIRKTFFANASSVTIATREAWEKLHNHETRQEYDMETKQWRQSVPGPGTYATPKPPSSRAIRMHGREAMDKENARKSGVYEPASKSYVNSVPGPSEYIPRVLKNGRSLELGKDGPSVTVGVRLNPKKDTIETPGPGYYTIRSCFEETDFNLMKGTKGGPYNHGWMGDRPPASKKSDAESWPGPGDYDTRGYDGIGTDLLSIGAATRELYGMSATDAIRPENKKLVAETQVRPVLNYSAMNKAIEGLKKTLGELFATVYDAFAYFDIDGDWGISESEFRRMLKNLDIEIDDANLGLIVRRMDVVSDGTIDPKEFIQALRWHPSMYKKFADEENAMQQAARARPLILKNVMLKVAEMRVTKQAQLERSKSRSSLSNTRPGTSKKTASNLVRPQRPLTARTDMRRGFSFTPRNRHISGAPKGWGDTPGPAYYAPRAAGDLALKVGSGKNRDFGIQVHDALCWAGSSMTGPAAPISGKKGSGQGKGAGR